MTAKILCCQNTPAPQGLRIFNQTRIIMTLTLPGDVGILFNFLESLNCFYNIDGFGLFSMIIITGGSTLDVIRLTDQNVG